jgi:hypothetical protein
MIHHRSIITTVYIVESRPSSKERLWEEIDYDVDVEIDYNPDPSKDSEGLDDDDEESSPSK